MKHITYIGLFSLLLAACSTAPKITKTQADYNPTNEARLRLYAQDGRISNATYLDDNRRVKISVGAATVAEDLDSLSISKNSQSLGMPSTGFAYTVSDKSGTSRAYFKEFIVPANAEIDVRVAPIKMANSDNSYSRVTAFNARGCTNNMTFTPKAGVDYEITHNGCYPILYEIKGE